MTDRTIDPALAARDAKLIEELFGSPKEHARLSGYTGDQCSNCYGVRMRRNGSCLMCEDCGTTTGCS